MGDTMPSMVAVRGGCALRMRTYGGAMKKDDLELFERAMETLGVKPQPGEVASRPRKGPAMPTLPDEDLDFDAIMRSGRGPAKLEGPAKRARPVEKEAVSRPISKGAVVPANYSATPEEEAEFLAAMAQEAAPVVKEVNPAPAELGTRKAETLKQLIRRRAVEVEAQLDLHGKTLGVAETRVRAFLEESIREHWEIVAIVCGRGVHSEGGKPVLKPRIMAWLREDLREWAAEVEEAPQALGGSGTLIVRVRLDPGR